MEPSRWDRASVGGLKVLQIDETKLAVCRDFMLENWRPDEAKPDELMQYVDIDWDEPFRKWLPHYDYDFPNVQALPKFTASMLDIIESFFGPVRVGFGWRWKLTGKVVLKNWQ